MARGRTSYKNLDKAIERILNDYAEIVAENVDEAADRIAKKTRLAVANGSRQFDQRWGKKKYSSGWRVQKDDWGWFISYVVLNQKKPTETHLLEYGHELNVGGRAKAYPHITPVAEKVPESFEKEVINAIRRS